jgi:hypothetical protein
MAHFQSPTMKTQHLNPKIMNWLKFWRKNKEIFLKKLIRDHKVDKNKQVNEVNKPIQDLDKKVNIMEEEFSKQMEIKEKIHVEMLEMKTSIKEMHITMDSISRQNQAEENIRYGGQD